MILYTTETKDLEIFYGANFKKAIKWTFLNEVFMVRENRSLTLFLSDGFRWSWHFFGMLQSSYDKRYAPKRHLVRFKKIKNRYFREFVSNGQRALIMLRS